MDTEKISEIIAEALEIEVEEVVLGKQLNEYENFDSLVLLTLITLLEDSGVSLTTDDLENIERIDDIYKLATS